MFASRILENICGHLPFQSICLLTRVRFIVTSAICTGHKKHKNQQEKYYKKIKCSRQVSAKSGIINSTQPGTQAESELETRLN